MFNAHDALHFVEYAFVEETVLHFEQAWDTLPGAHVVEVASASYREGTGAHPPAHGFHTAHLFLYGRIGFFPKTWHCTHACGAHFADCVLYLLGVGVYVDAYSAVECEICPCLFENMAQREEA